MADPDPEQALRELKARLANAAPAKSLVAQVQHREQRAERRRLAAARHEPAAPPVCEAPAAAVSAPPVVDADNDARELEPWFRALPFTERERLRAHWWSERHRDDDAGLRARRRLSRALVHGALLFFVLSVLQVPLLGDFTLVPVLVAAGAIAAGAAHLCGGGRFVYSFAGALAFFSVMWTSVFVQPLSLASLLIATYGMGLLGLDGEMRRSGCFEVK